MDGEFHALQPSNREPGASFVNCKSQDGLGTSVFPLAIALKS